MNAVVVSLRGMSKAVLVYERLRTEITALTREPGSRIDKNEVCDQFGVLRQPVAEALARLSEDGLVDVHPQSGSFVALIRIADVEEAAFVRQAIEAEMAREIALGTDGELISELNRILEYQAFAARIVDVAEFYQLDLRFHAALFARLGKPRPADVVERMRPHLERARRMLLPNLRRNEQTLQEHRDVVEALATRVPEAAASAMRTHLTNSMEAFRRFADEHASLFEPGVRPS
ncbi:MAG TPA: GntR family transcriptional regulator [Lichenihabitans sp.]|jgi:DNA-binding GntR family transcriptional regulator|nr:GntR family transcriptional regulator [Lichenihabitans sp.]